MSKVWVTNEASSFAKSFAVWCHSTGNHEFINRLENDEFDYFRQNNRFRSKEIDIFDPTLPNLISRSGAEIIIHQLSITPDKSMEYVDYALRNNIEGTQYIIDAAKEIGIPILFITSRNYGFIMNNYVAGSSCDVYDITAQAAEYLLDAADIQHTSLIPPLLYGPEYDEGVVGLIKTAINGKDRVVINMDPEKSHAFMHVDDFFDAMNIVINNLNLEDGKVDKWIIDMQPKEVISVEVILKKLEDFNFFLSYELRPELDNFENLPTGAQNIMDIYDWKPKFDIDAGLIDVVNKIKEQYDS